MDWLWGYVLVKRGLASRSLKEVDFGVICGHGDLKLIANRRFYDVEQRSDRGNDDVALYKRERNARRGRFEKATEMEKKKGREAGRCGGLKGGNGGSEWKKVEICGIGGGSNDATIQILRVMEGRGACSG